MLNLLKDTIANIKSNCHQETSPNFPQKFVIFSIPKKLSQLIENFSELEEALKGTELEPYLYAPDF